MMVSISSEMYLETILILSHTTEKVKAVAVAAKLDYKRSSVSVALKSLREQGHIAIAGDGAITLTQSGLAIAERMYERHVFLTDLLVKLGVDPATAAQDACRVEHVVSEESFQAIKRLIDKR